ncbi:MAG: ABC transporter permease [Limnochordia bacterium]|jgi:spermidine/putrescine transport system permease protein|nr:ABC transporter permease [Limnochordia bacterium]HPT93999.1 ABC transporter permease [Limnochordia bacterium]HPZ31686.1 ABC transporter permease [Limnochordia bacterium]HQD71538.1 ABC transporter permease [Limnochordia bacterium]HXK97079.1 ABC transporter permease [Limnochordia bacterium]
MKALRQNALAIPILIWFGLLVGIPLVYVVVVSFLSRDDLGNIVWQFTLDNYRRILDPVYLRVFVNSFMLAFLTGLVTLLIGYPVAYITSKLDPKRRSLAIGLIILPFWISSLLRTYGWVILLGNWGIINNVLMALGLVDQPLQMMYRFGTTLVGTAYMLIPFMIIAVYNSVDKLDKSLLEASYDLGASKRQTFLRVVLPLTIPGIAGGFTLVFIPALGLYFISDLLGGGQTVFLGNLIHTLVNRGRNRPLAAAFSVGMIVMVILVVSIYSRLTKNQKEGLLL